MSVTSSDTGARIAKARRERGLTQRDLAEAVGATPWLVDRIERGQADAGWLLSALADATGRRADWFVAETPRAAGASQAGLGRQHVADLGVTGRNLVLGSIVLLVTIRFFTEVVPVVPRAANFIDIPIFLGLAASAITVPGTRLGRSYIRIGLPAVAFILLAVVSAMVNFERTETAPAIVFVYGFLSPLAVYASVYRIWPPGSARSLSSLLVWLGLLQIVVVAFVSIPRFIASDGNPDDVSGTFGTNAYQLVFFLLIVTALLAGIFALEPTRFVARYVPLLLPTIFAIVLLAQYRALLATLVLTMAVVALLLRERARAIALVAFGVVAFAVVFNHVDASFPRLKLHTTATTLSQSPWSYASQRLEGTRPIRALYADEELTAVIGAGPGTFSSRAWQTFAKAGSTSRSNVQGGYAQRLTGGVYTTDVSDRYMASYAGEARIVEGSSAVSSPYSSYLGLAAEVGLLALALMAGVYGVALWRSGRLARRAILTATSLDSVPSLALATTIGFLMLIQMGFLENWLEVTRATFLIWIMLAVVSKELDARTPL